MKGDTFFIKETCLNKYFNFSEINDPFLLSLSEPVNEMENMEEATNIKKTIIPITQELVQSIRNCQFIMMNNTILSELSQQYKSISRETKQSFIISPKNLKIHKNSKLEPISSQPNSLSIIADLKQKQYILTQESKQNQINIGKKQIKKIEKSSLSMSKDENGLVNLETNKKIKAELNTSINNQSNVVNSIEKKINKTNK